MLAWVPSSFFFSFIRWKLDEGGSALQVPQASVELAGYGSVVWPDSLSEWLVGGAELQ